MVCAKKIRHLRGQREAHEDPANQATQARQDVGSQKLVSDPFVI